MLMLFEHSIDLPTVLSSCKAAIDTYLTLPPECGKWVKQLKAINLG
jgi:hypothetical protein